MCEPFRTTSLPWKIIVTGQCRFFNFIGCAMKLPAQQPSGAGGVQVDELHGANQVELTRRVQSLSHASREHNSESAGNVDAAIIQEC
eukprot:scaffold44093_cov31-Tisochrysis_lutea.AAC.2